MHPSRSLEYAPWPQEPAPNGPGVSLELPPKTPKGIRQRRLARLLQNAPSRILNRNDRVVVLSDLHMGNGGGMDDFAENSGLVKSALSNYYLAQDYHLILNGDVEELHKFSYKKVKQAWPEMYDLFGQFRDGPGLTKLVGNHDCDLLEPKHADPEFPAEEALVLRHGGERILVFHGHQAGHFSGTSHALIRFGLRYIASPLGFRNYTVSASDRRKYSYESTIYEFAREAGIAAIAGHTHRPLFESMSRADELAFRIDQLCRQYAEADTRRRESLERVIRLVRQEFDRVSAGAGAGLASKVYATHRMLPCLFNSGCAIGKRGITAIEIADGEISLVHWFDTSKSTRFLIDTGYSPRRLPGTTVYRVELRTQPLDYVFARIGLLG